MVKYETFMLMLAEGGNGKEKIMEKTYLDCYVTSCVYNANNCCGKGDIVVNGKDAKVNRETACDSFKERKSDSFKNSANSLTKDIAIVCEATNCRFNENKNCKAEHISIAGGNAGSSAETECASFDAR